MKKMINILKIASLATGLALTCSCATQEKPFIPFKTNAGEKELVKTGGEVIANARKYSFPVYILKRDEEPVSYYTEGTIIEQKEGIGEIRRGYESSNNFWLFDDDIYNGPRTFNDYYSVECYSPK